jgi:hypothetical protein
MRLIELSVVRRSSTKLLIRQATLPLIYLNFKGTYRHSADAHKTEIHLSYCASNK